MSLSEERLREIRERANLQCGLDGDDADDLLEHVDHLTAEVARLRAGIEALHRPEPFYDDPSATFCAHCQRTAGVWPCPTVSLLNIEREDQTP